MTSCRICLGNANLTDIFGNDERIAEKIEFFASAKVSQDDGLPQQICRLCLAELKISTGFKEKCENAHKQLHGDRDLFVAHVKTKTNNIKKSTFTCKDCVIRFPSKQHLRKHMERKHRFLCQLCNVHFVNRNALLEHLKRGHEIEQAKPFYKKCHICSKKFKSNWSLMKHLPIHYNPNHLKCGMCSMTFLTSEGFKKHMERYSRFRTYSCKICSKIFQHSTSFQTHMESHNTKELFVCSICSEKFQFKRNLTYHLKVHKRKNETLPINSSDVSNINNTSEIKIENGSLVENLLQCELCEKMCWGLDELKQHVMMHMGEEEDKPYVCNLCGSTFRKASTLKMHRKSHYVEKLNNSGIYYK